MALCHPVQYYLGRAAIRLPGLAPVFAITLVSAVAGAVTVANLALAALWLTRRPAAAGIAVAGLALSHTFWMHATHTESYTLTAACLSAEWLFLAAFVTGGRPVFLPWSRWPTASGWAITRSRCSRCR